MHIKTNNVNTLRPIGIKNMNFYVPWLQSSIGWLSIKMGCYELLMMLSFSSSKTNITYNLQGNESFGSYAWIILAKESLEISQSINKNRYEFIYSWHAKRSKFFPSTYTTLGRISIYVRIIWVKMLVCVPYIWYKFVALMGTFSSVREIFYSKKWFA